MKLVYLLGLIASMVVMLGVGIWVARRIKSGSDFLLAGRRLGPFLLMGTTLATLVGTGSSLGAVGFAYENGWAGALYGIGAASGVLLLLVLFADVRQHGFMTLSEELSFYYGASHLVKGIVAVLLLVAEVGWVGAHILGGSIYLEHLTGLDPNLAKLLLAGGFGAYTIVGGYLADVITDAVQGVILFVGFAVLAIVALVKVGGFGGISERVPAEIDSFLGLEGLGLLPAVSLVVVIALGVLATPSYRQRIYSARSVPTVRKSFGMVVVLSAVFAIFPAIAGLSARALAPDMANTDMAFPYLATELFPLALGVFLLIAGMSATMSSGDSDAVTGVTILLRDVVQLVTGKLPPRDQMVRYSRISLVVVLGLAMVFAMLAGSIIDYITLMISTVLTGLFVAALLGKYWAQVTVPGGLAAILAGSGTALLINGNADWTAYWGNPVIPSLLVATAAGVLVSLVTKAPSTSREEALAILQRERETIDVRTDLEAGH